MKEIDVSKLDITLSRMLGTSGRWNDYKIHTMKGEEVQKKNFCRTRTPAPSVVDQISFWSSGAIPETCSIIEGRQANLEYCLEKIYVALQVDVKCDYSFTRGSGWGRNPRPCFVFSFMHLDAYRCGRGRGSYFNCTNVRVYPYSYAGKDKKTGEDLYHNRIEFHSRSGNWPMSISGERNNLFSFISQMRHLQSSIDWEVF